MSRKRKTVNISLIILAGILAGAAVWILRLPPLALSSEDAGRSDGALEITDTLRKNADFLNRQLQPDSSKNGSSSQPLTVSTDQETFSQNSISRGGDVASTSFPDANLKSIGAGHPFLKEARKVLSGRLEVEDSTRRRKILSYCEHLRMAYSTKDIDFIRQVFSDDALIIVGHTVKADKSAKALSSSQPKVVYSLRSKQDYIRRLSNVFKANKSIGIEFSDFKINRHPTMDGIYGVSLRQKYSTESYSDDGYLFLLWDFRNPSMPLIHVRTWQPNQNLPDDDVIDISDFNLE